MQNWNISTFQICCWDILNACQKEPAAGWSFQIKPIGKVFYWTCWFDSFFYFTLFYAAYNRTPTALPVLIKRKLQRNLLCQQCIFQPNSIKSLPLGAGLSGQYEAAWFWQLSKEIGRFYQADMQPWLTTQVRGLQWYTQIWNKVDKTQWTTRLLIWHHLLYIVVLIVCKIRQRQTFFITRRKTFLFSRSLNNYNVWP